MNTRPPLLELALLLAGTLLAPVAATAQDTGGWKTSATVYLYLPSLSGRTSFPANSGTPIDVSTEQILDNLKMTFMGSLDTHNGRWGLFTDVIYLNLGNTKTSSREFTIGGIGIPADTTADLGLDLKGWV